MDKVAQKIKYGRKIETPCTAAENAGQQPDEETNAVQTRHARF
jgi:hypothetical protein